MNLQKFKPVLNIGINRVGKDYIVGDLHGCYNTLMQTLKDINFNFSTDRVFAVGGIIDRGEDSYHRC